MTKLPEHLFIGTDGALYDTRKPDWAKHPIRDNYAKHVRDIKSIADVKSSLRSGEYAFPGGYRLAFITGDGCVLSFDAVNDNFIEVAYSLNRNIHDGWYITGLLVCDECEDITVCDYTGETLYDPTE